MATDETGRDHLFISYATEDSAFAEWLTLRLAAEGYKVWCDRIKLLGGESFPSDIDIAITRQSFRLLALLSRASIDKPNPKKERAKAHNISRERGEDFIIPLNVDGLKPTELDWQTSDLTFIPFNRSWAEGFVQLLKKLDTLEAPKDIRTGRASVCDWMAVQSEPTKQKENLRANLLPVLEIPRVLHKFESIDSSIKPSLLEQWPCYSTKDSMVIWAFDSPGQELNLKVDKTTSISWRDIPFYDGIKVKNIVLSILRKSITINCLKRGMKLIPNSKNLFFPSGLLGQDHLRFTTYDGKKSYVKASGERIFRKGDQHEKIRYHLSTAFQLNVTDYSEATVRVAIRLHLTDITGRPLEGLKVISRRKRICKNWWNHEWFSRFLAVVEWFCGGQQEYAMLSTPTGDFRISSTPLIFPVDQGIDESSLKISREEADADGQEIDEDIAELLDQNDGFEDEDTDDE